MQPNQTNQIPNQSASSNLVPSDPSQLDPTAVTLAKAIRQQEVGSAAPTAQDYQSTGDNGSSFGAYQFHGDNFQNWAKQYGLDPSDTSPVNQDKVAYARIKDLLDQGNAPSEVIARWNGAKIVNGKYTALNQDYADKVKNNYIELAKNYGQSSQTTNQSDNQPQDDTSQAPSLMGSQTLENLVVGGGRGTLSEADTLGKVGNWITQNTAGRVVNAVEGNGFTPTTSANPLADLMGGQSNLTQAETPQNLTQAIGSVVLPAIASSGLGLIGDALNSSTGLNLSKPVIELLAKDTGMDAAELSPSEIADSLQKALDSKSLSGSMKINVEQALKYITPKVLEENGGGPGLLGRAANLVHNHPLASLIGLNQLGSYPEQLLKGLYSKYIGSQITSPNPNNTITANPAP